MQDAEYPPKHVYIQKHVHTTPTLTQQPLSQWWKVPLVSAVLALPVSPQILAKLPVYWTLSKLYASTLQDIRHTNTYPWIKGKPICYAKSPTVQSANTRPHQLHLGDREIGVGILSHAQNAVRWLQPYLNHFKLLQNNVSLWTALQNSRAVYS